MRIALIMKRYSLARGGGEYDLVRLSASLADRGHEVHLFVHDVEGDPDPRLAIHSVPMNRLWAPLKILSFARNAPHAVADSGISFDVIHAMTQTFPSDLYWNGGGLQVNWLRARYGESGLSRARWHPRHAANLWVEQQIFKRGNYRRVVALTQMERDQTVGAYGVPADRFHVIPNGIDPTRFHIGVREEWREAIRSDLGVRPDQKMLLLVGTDGRRKGLPELLAALGKLGQDFDGLLVVAGNDPPDRWKSDVDRNGLASRVRFHGREPRIEKLYAAADLTVMASLFEGYGNVVPEAMACGCPVMTTRAVGAADFVEDGRTGWVLETCRDTTLFTQRLRSALTDADLPAMGLAAAEHIRPYTWNWTVDRLEEVYQLIAEEKALQSPRPC